MKQGIDSIYVRENWKAAIPKFGKVQMNKGGAGLKAKLSEQHYRCLRIIRRY